MKLASIILSAALLIAALPVFARNDTSETGITTSRITDKIHMIHGTDDAAHFSGGNIAVHVGDDGVVMIDTKMESLSGKIKAEIDRIGGGSPRYVLNTHLHGDHTGGNAAFTEDGTLVAHANVRKRLVENKPEKLWPVITFDQSMSIHFNGEQIKAIHMPHGHTDGDSIVYFTDSNVVHMGDHMFSGMFPYVDLGNGGSVQGMLNNIEIVLNNVNADTVLIPGHGPLSDREGLRRVYTMLQQTTQWVTERMNAGRSLKQIKAEGLPDKWKSWSWDFVTAGKWIETIYNSYSSE